MITYNDWRVHEVTWVAGLLSCRKWWGSNLGGDRKVESREPVSYASTIVPRICGWIGDSLGENSQFIRIDRKMPLGHSFPLANASRKVSETVLYAERSFTSPPFLYWSGFRSTEGVIFRFYPMVAESSL